jgi:predicted dehydrogenase
MLNIGIAGLGFMGMIHYLAYQRVRGARVTAICEQDAARRGGDWRTIKGNFGPAGQLTDLTGIAQYGSLDELLADPRVDVVDVCLPTSWHPATTIAALKAGKDVFCEKPIALKTADAKRMVDTAAKAGRLLMIGHVLPFFPEYRFAYDAILRGKYGRLLGGHFKRIISDPLWLPRYYEPAVIGGPMLDLHVHDAHFIRLICGMPRAVHSAGTMRGEVVERCHTQFIFDDPALVVTAASGVIGQQGRSFTHGYEIYLEKATLLFDFAVIGSEGVQCMPVTVLAEKGKVLRPELGSGDAIDSFATELTEMVRAVRSRSPSPLLDGGLARDAVVLCQRQTQSVATGRPVKV